VFVVGLLWARCQNVIFMICVLRLLVTCEAAYGTGVYCAHVLCML